jgi:hypothetical protein
MFFARRLRETGYRLGPIVVNRLHPPAATGELARWLGERDRIGLEQLRMLLPGSKLVSIPLQSRAPNDLSSLESLGRLLLD